jgi:endothelin-converting enzyme/putative endopeptidase
MLGFLGKKPAEAKIHAEQILALEIAMSKPRFDRVERRDKENRITHDRRRFTKTPSIEWNTYFTKIGLKNVDSLIVSQPKYDYFRVGFKIK